MFYSRLYLVCPSFILRYTYKPFIGNLELKCPLPIVAHKNYQIGHIFGIFSPELRLRRSPAELRPDSAGAPTEFQKLRWSSVGVDSGAGVPKTPPELRRSFSDSGRSSAGAQSNLRRSPQELSRSSGKISGVLKAPDPEFLLFFGAPPESRSNSDGALEKNSGGVFLPEFASAGVLLIFPPFPGAPPELQWRR